jgi:hypothetical protein
MPLTAHLEQQMIHKSGIEVLISIFAAVTAGDCICAACWAAARQADQAGCCHDLPWLAVLLRVQVIGYGGEDGEVGMFEVEYEASSRRRMPHKAVAGEQVFPRLLPALPCPALLTWPGIALLLIAAMGRLLYLPLVTARSSCLTALAPVCRFACLPAGLRAQGGALVLRGARELEGEHGLFSNKVVERMPNLKGARLPGEAIAWRMYMARGDDRPVDPLAYPDGTTGSGRNSSPGVLLCM